MISRESSVIEGFPEASLIVINLNSIAFLVLISSRDWVNVYELSKYLSIK